jgi:tetratricopeptide (TPR) repeat protein
MDQFKPTRHAKADKDALRQRPGKGKRWAFRAAALVTVPLLCFFVTEAALRLIGFGYPTSFLIPLTFEGKRFIAQNNRFGWRFFGPRMARTPGAIALAPFKLPENVRIFVFGESAAYGDPDPRFGLPRMLEALLNLRYPGVKFEVVNAAMTGINSHVIVPIAHDCGRAGGDIWVLYMGNNEVVGPFGAGTVFGPRVAPEWLIRARLALLATRTGQGLAAALERLSGPAGAESEWGGMRMFLDRPVRASDPQLRAVCDHFASNIQRVQREAARRGAGLVISTVAVNLRDCAPFASAHRDGLSPTDQARWEKLYQEGKGSFASGDLPKAAALFQQAQGIDDQFAELRFRQGECSLRLGRTDEARQFFEAARDLDTLRFRCDSRLNEVIRQAATAAHDRAVSGEAPRFRFADAVEAFATQSGNALPGDELFCDHVHFTFAGNYLLARTLVREIEPLLPQQVRSKARPDQPWPSADDCARRLAWTGWARKSVAEEIWRRKHEAPFSGQSNHGAQIEKLANQLREFGAANSKQELQSSLTACAAATAAAPEDPQLLAQLSLLQAEAGNMSEAESAARRALALLPSSAEAWAQLGRVLAAREQYAAAAECFRGAIQLDSQDVWSRENRARALAKLGQHTEAIQEYRRTLAIKPKFGPGWLGLGQVQEEIGRKAEAEDCYRRALANPVRRSTELLSMARFTRTRGWSEAAVTNYTAAIQLNPTDPQPYFELGQILVTLKHHAEAAQVYSQLVDLVPDVAEAHFVYGLESGRLGQTSIAAHQFREAVRLRPDLLEARVNLAVALMNAGETEEALSQFEAVLQRDPSNAVASRNAALLRARSPEQRR